MRVPTSGEDEDESEIDVINNNYCNNNVTSSFDWCYKQQSL